MKICIVSGMFQAGRGYQENELAEGLAAAGHTLRVVTSGVAFDDVPEGGAGPGYEVVDVPTRVLPRGALWARGLLPRVLEFEPELILWVAPSQWFGRALVRGRGLDGIPLVSFHSEGYYLHEYDWRKPGLSARERVVALAYHLLRGPVVRGACRRSDVIVGNVPETREILQAQFYSEAERREVARKLLTLPLGYNPRQFAFDADLRRVQRARLGMDSAEEILVCFSSRHTEEKLHLLTPCIEGLQQALARDPRLRAVVVGFSEGAVSKGLRAKLESGPAAERFVLEGFGTQDRLNELYNAADIALFPRASISCQAALGTGLVGCFAADMSMEHLVRSPDQAVFYELGNRQDLAQKLSLAADLVAQRTAAENGDGGRERLATASRWLGYDRILDALLERVRSLRGPGNEHEAAVD